MNDETFAQRPLNLVTHEGIQDWQNQNEDFSISYGLIAYDDAGQHVYRALFEKAGETFVLVDPDALEVVAAPIGLRGDDTVVDHLFEVAPDASPTLHLDTRKFVNGRLPTVDCFMAQTSGLPKAVGAL